mmetsp:Transcript_602/g.1155  ORF Transcript_602/g.1155 Transcript_602/m.1155 type:complete len:110 (+) Transcript_602:830-1159(+)
MKTGEYFCTMSGHKDSVTCFAQDGYFLMSGSDDQSIIIWNTGEWYSDLHENSKVKTITPHKVLQDGHTQSIQSLSVLPNGIVLSCSYDQLVIAWSYLMEEEIHRFERND